MASLEGLRQLLGCSFQVSASRDDSDGSVAISFSNGTKLRAEYWRLLNRSPRLSSFDHGQQYGLPAPIDAIAELQKALVNSTVVEAILDAESADLILAFDNHRKLQILTVTGYEIWEIHFPDGTGEYSNYL
jgi:hypothetical protein